MPIELYTGMPGHGKTSLAVERLLAEARKAERPLYAAGIDGLQPGLATVLDDPREWNAHDPDGEPTCDCHLDGKLHAHKVLNGALIFCDEAWKWFGHLHNASRQSTPQAVLDLAEHRHRGIDFVWTTQGPGQLYPFSRPLIGPHHHVVRKFGTQVIEVFTWGELQDDVKSTAIRERALSNVRALPSGDVRKAYTSASEHTIKARIPKKVLMLPLLLVALVVAVWFAYSQLRPSSMTERLVGESPEVAAGLAVTPGAASTGPRVREWDDPAHYTADHSPRFPSMPWSSPVYDDRSVTVDPQVYCMSSEDGVDADGVYRPASVTCLTEQGTLYAMPENFGRRIARWGPAYNPYRSQVVAGASLNAAVPETSPVYSSPSRGAVISASETAERQPPMPQFGGGGAY